jgi:hypothetical protein
MWDAEDKTISGLNGRKHWQNLICSWLGEFNLDLSLSFPDIYLYELRYPIGIGGIHDTAGS